MSLAVEISAKAEADLLAQHDWYCEKADKETAARYFSAFHQTVTLLSEHPLLGRKRNFKRELAKDVRSIAVSRTFQAHLIFYRLTEDGLLIFRVIHGARDLENRLVE
jgi:toxin ParE1/3/4